MIGLFRKRKIAKYAAGAETYLHWNYIDPNAPKAPEPEHGLGVRYSIKRPSSNSEVASEQNSDLSSRRFSLRDTYNSTQIDLMMSSQLPKRSFSGLSSMLDGAMNQTFVEKLMGLITQKGVKDSAVYKAAQIDRRLFSKIMSDSNYKPAKDTAIAIALALKLTLEQAKDLLSRAGYTFSHSSKRDVVIEYFFRNQIYNLTDINIVLEKLEQKPIGR